MNNSAGAPSPLAGSAGHGAGAALDAWSLGIMLAAIVAMVLLATALLSRRVPALVPDSPAQTRWIDGLRGIAATLVLLNHGPLVLENLNIVPLHFSVGELDRALLIQLGKIGVHIFFCITGFLFAGKLMNARAVDWSEFFVKRARRLVPAYAAAVLMAVCVAGLFGGVSSGFFADLARSLPAMLSFGFFDLPTLGTFDTARLLGMNWTLAYEWQFYALLPLMFALVRAVPVPVGVGIAVVSLALSLVVAPGVWLFFAVGALAATLANYTPPPWLRVALRIGLAMLLVSMAVHWQAATRHQTVQGLHIFALFFILVVLRPAPLAWRPFVCAGAISYSFYIFHLMILYLVVGLLDRAGLAIAALSVPAFAAVLGGTAGLITLWSAFSYIAVEQRFLRPRHLTTDPLGHRPA